jgi:hypothetical protein
MPCNDVYFKMLIHEQKILDDVSILFNQYYHMVIWKYFIWWVFMITIFLVCVPIYFLICVIGIKINWTKIYFAITVLIKKYMYYCCLQKQQHGIVIDCFTFNYAVMCFVSHMLRIFSFKTNKTWYTVNDKNTANN